MESSVGQFDAALLLLCQQKLRLDWQLKLANLSLVTLFQEVMLLKQFQKREEGLQEKLNSCLKKESSIAVGGITVTTINNYNNCKSSATKTTGLNASCLSSMLSLQFL